MYVESVWIGVKHFESARIAIEENLKWEFESEWNISIAQECYRREFEMSVWIGVKHFERARIAIEEDFKFEIWKRITNKRRALRRWQILNLEKSISARGSRKCISLMKNWSLGKMDPGSEWLGKMDPARKGWSLGKMDPGSEWLGKMDTAQKSWSLGKMILGSTWLGKIDPAWKGWQKGTKMVIMTQMTL